LEKRRLIGAAEPRRFLLRQFALLDGVLDGDNQAALGGEFRSLGRRESHIGNTLPLLFSKGILAMFSPPYLNCRARRKRTGINSASGFGRPIADLDFFMMRNPLQAEHDSWMIPNAIPAKPEQDSGMMVNANSSMKPNSFRPVPARAATSE
jgi:hypothetical protein